MKIYLDNCCFNRPFDDQSQFRIRLEAEAKLKIQDEIRSGNIDLVWSYILDYENSKNPFKERKNQIHEWRVLSVTIVQANAKIIKFLNQFKEEGIQKFDALHIACAINSGCEYLLTTDDKVLNKNQKIDGITITDPFGFVKEMKL